MLAALGLALLLPFSASAVVWGCFEFGAFVGVAVGVGVYRVALVLTPLRPQTHFNKSANADPQLQEAASPQVLRSGCLQR